MFRKNYVLDFNPDKRAYLEIPHNDQLSITGDLTIEFWLYLREWPHGWTDIVSKFDNSKKNEFCFRIKDANVGQWYYGDGIHAVQPLVWNPKEDMNLKEWIHIACVRKIGEYGKIYFNGILLREKDWSNHSEAINTKFSILVMASPMQGRTLDGKLSDLRIWNAARKKNEISSYMSKELTVREKGLIGDWTFNALKNNLLIDSTGRNHGKLFFTEWTESDLAFNKSRYNKNNTDQLISYAETAYMAKDWPEAERSWQYIYDKCTAKAPYYVYCRLAIIKRHLNDFTGAEEVLQKGMTLYGNNIDIVTEYAINHIIRGNLLKAFKLLKGLIPKSIDAGDEESFTDVKVWRKAVDAYERELVDTYIILVDYLICKQEYDAAKSLTRIGMSKHKDNIDLMARSAKLSLLSNNLLESKLFLEKIITVSISNKYIEDVFVMFINECNRINLYMMKYELFNQLKTFPDKKNKVTCFIDDLLKGSYVYDNIKISSVKKGLSNHGIWLHEINNSKIIEKITSNQNERIVLRYMAQNCKKTISVFPRLFSYFEYGSISICFLEHLDCAGVVPDFTDYNASMVAETILELESCLENIKSLRFEDDLRVENLKAQMDFINTLYSADWAGEFAMLNNVIKSLGRAVAKGVFIACHGDLSFSNMSTRTDKDGRIIDIKLFDFGRCAKRPQGFEFHHFVRKSIDNNKMMGFTLKMIEHYAGIKGIDKELICQNAIAFSIANSLHRASRRIKNGLPYLTEFNALLDLVRLYSNNHTNCLNYHF